MTTPLLLLCIPLFLLPLFVVPSGPPFSCDPSSPSTAHFPFCDRSLAIGRRAGDLVSRLSLEEKIAQLGDVTPPIGRLGVPAYKWWSEALHGVASGGRAVHFNGSIRAATSFPQVILTAASFDPSLWYRIGRAIGTEARAIYNAGQTEGMTFWSPNINIFRDPRWGRGQETPGEDPLTASKYATYYVRGLQGDSFKGGDLRNLQASACCKHFTAYDMENWKGNVRYTFNANVSALDLEETYQPPFRSCVEEAHATGIMCSYNRVNGVPTCADYNLLSKTARGEWGFDGYIASDCDAVSHIVSQGYAKTPEDAVADVLKAGMRSSRTIILSTPYPNEAVLISHRKIEIAGMDVNCGSYVQRYAASAIQKGKLSDADINRALHNLFSIRMRLGLFEGNPKHGAYGDIAPSEVCKQEHRDLALEAARDGVVLLKNLANLLPLSRSKVASLGVIGPNANNVSTLRGNYAGPPCESITPLEALQKYVTDTRYVRGCDTVACGSSAIREAVELARSVEYVILFMGLDQTQERESFDRVDLVLPGMQQELVTSVARASKRPVILVLLCGGPVDVTFAKRDAKIGGILWAGYPGESGGFAVAEVLFGDHNPGGRLPVTWYPQSFTNVSMINMRMRSDPATGYPGRTYKFYTGIPVYLFGQGLSYSTYSYKFKTVAKNPLYLNKSTAVEGLSLAISEIGTEACERMKLSAVVRVQNHGPMAGKHPVMLFLRWTDKLHGRPMKQLIGFESLHLESGARADVEFILWPCDHLARIEEDGSRVLEKGSPFLVVGDKEYQISILA